MKHYVRVVSAALCLMAFTSTGLAAGANEAAKVNEATEVIKEITAIPEEGIPPSLLANAYAVAVIPAVIKVGLVIGGRHGTGILVVRQDSGWSNPTFVSLTGGSVGWQIGAQSTDVILVFKSQKSVDGIVKGKFTLGADAAVAAGPVGRRAEAATDAQLKAEIYSYSRSRGLFAGVSLEGSALQIDRDANEAFYGRSVTPDDVFGGATPTPKAAARFKQVLGEATS
jgi:lipid-binding SYLF domain-containing protein